MISPYGMSNNYTIPVSNVGRVTPVFTDNTVDSSRKVAPVECQTCKNRRYQDGSNEMVSFKAPGHISPEQRLCLMNRSMLLTREQRETKIIKNWFPFRFR